MRKLLVATVATLWMCGIPLQSSGWDFTLKGEAEWRYRYISRTGPGDLFGNAAAAQKWAGAGTSIGLAGPNTRAVRVEGYSSKGADAAYAEQRFFLFPDIHIRDTVRFRSVLAFQANVNGPYESVSWKWVQPGSWADNPHYNGWIMPDSRHLDAGVGYTVPMVRAYWVTFQLPFGTVAIGRRPTGFGPGWAVNEQDLCARSVTLQVPYGPFTFVLSQYLHDNGEKTDPNDALVGNDTAYSINSSVDQNELVDINTAVALVYRSGDLDCGTMIRTMRHSDGHALPHASGTFRDDVNIFGFFGNSYSPYVFAQGRFANQPNGVPFYGDILFLWHSTYAKYHDGRFFANLEYNYHYMDSRRKGARPLSGFGQAWMAELGTMIGPAKLSLAHFYSSGHDRRGGMSCMGSAYGRVTTASGQNAGMYDHWNMFVGEIGVGPTLGAIKPYNYLLSIYGTGNNSFNMVGECTFRDFAAVAARVDYAVAANLNVFGSAIWARRASQTGTPIGHFQGAPQNDPDFWEPFTAEPTANVPDPNLGWEVDVGFRWKLLENLTAKFLYAYWQPGKWFAWAYQDETTATKNRGDDPDRPFDDYLEGGKVNPNRKIDALMGVQVNLEVCF